MGVLHSFGDTVQCGADLEALCDERFNLDFALWYRLEKFVQAGSNILRISSHSIEQLCYFIAVHDTPRTPFSNVPVSWTLSGVPVFLVKPRQFRVEGGLVLGGELWWEEGRLFLFKIKNLATQIDVSMAPLHSKGPISTAAASSTAS